MSIAELISAVGSEHIMFQNLHECILNISATKKHGSKVTFGTNGITPNEVASGEWKHVCLIIWLPKERVDAVIKEKRV